MNNETYEALKNLVKQTRVLLNDKFENRKRLNQNELWLKAITLRDMVAVESWIDEVSKEYREDDNIEFNRTHTLKEIKEARQAVIDSN